uniref:tetratricopeptide repeat domain 24 isoform 6 n=1 Tax=Rattus norvegicus TaxID=10116 RepID=UPI0034E21AC9
MATGWGWCSKKTPGAVSLPSVPGKLQTSWEASLEAKNSARVHSSAEDAQDRSEEGREKKKEGLMNMTIVLEPQRQDCLGASEHLPSGGPWPRGVEHLVNTAPNNRSSIGTKEALGRNLQRTSIQSGLCTIV